MATTWRSMLRFGVWCAVTWAVTACVLVSLLAAIVTGPIVGVGMSVRAFAARHLAALIRLDRERVERVTGIRGSPLEPLRPDPHASPERQRQAWAHAPLLWRLPAYELVCLPVVTALAVGAVAWWWATIVCWALLSRRAELVLQPVHVFGVGIGPWPLSTFDVVGLGLGGVSGVLLWPLALRGVSAAEAILARFLLSPDPRELTQEVIRLSEARTHAVAAADAERRRIERDLHDGFQPELVNLALNLGLARSRLSSDPDAARELLDRAHQDAKQASRDLRNLVRGIHPSVLDERGLDAAFSALASHSPVPVQIDVYLTRRPPRAIEGTVYFLVAEALTNINKHAHATTASVTVATVKDDLWVLVQDDGHGGARVEPGGGLAGLAARVAAVDGTLLVTSPSGGPTWIESRIPCEW